MKRIKLFLPLFFIASLFLVSACSSDDDSKDDLDDDLIKIDEPGKISGLGVTEGKLTGKKYELPDGIILAGKIFGVGEYYEEASLDKTEIMLQIRSNVLDYGIDYDVNVGSGYAVTVVLPLENITDKDIELTFPAGLILKSKNNDRQNGLLTKKATVTLPKKDKYTVILSMYCCHESKPAPSSKDEMEWAVITNSSLLLEICDLVKYKKVNIEEIVKSYSDYSPDYLNLCAYINNRIWDLTDRGLALTEEHREWFRNLPPSSQN